jgi:hypothetical protein
MLAISKDRMAPMLKTPDVVSWWAGEGAKRRIGDPEYAAELDRLDRAVAAKAAELAAAGRLGSTF